jgi:GxxExxY protein
MLRTDSWLDDTTEAYITEVIDCGFVVHCDLGPGYLEPPYRNAMCIELKTRRIPFACEKTFTVKYRDQPVGIHRLDLVIRECIVVELKAVKTLEPIHRAQLMAYMKASKIRVGLLMSFGCATFKQGIQRIVM